MLTQRHPEGRGNAGLHCAAPLAQAKGPLARMVYPLEHSGFNSPMALKSENYTGGCLVATLAGASYQEAAEVPASFEEFQNS